MADEMKDNSAYTKSSHSCRIYENAIFTSSQLVENRSNIF